MPPEGGNPYERIQMLARLRQKWAEEDQAVAIENREMRDRFRLHRDVIDISEEWRQQANLRAYAIDANASFKAKKRGAHG